MSLPWDDPNSNPLQDLKDFAAYHRERPWRPAEVILPPWAQKLERTMMKHTNSIAIFSGGLDSTTLVYDMLDHGLVPHLLSFDYGQRHRKEIVFARMTAAHLELPHDIIDLTGLTRLISNSALTSQLPEYPTALDLADGPTPIDVPEGHYAEESMSQTVVPNRNMIMLAIAGGVAVNEKASCIGFGAHAGDHFVYPDCRPLFVDELSVVLERGNEGFHVFGRFGPIYAPFIEQSKADIAYRAMQLGVPLHNTWSCYKGGSNHCGRCGTCVERLEAIDWALNELNSNDTSGRLFKDETVYDDTEYWKVAIREAADRASQGQ